MGIWCQFLTTECRLSALVNMRQLLRPRPIPPGPSRSNWIGGGVGWGPNPILRPEFRLVTNVSQLFTYICILASVAKPNKSSGPQSFCDWIPYGFLAEVELNGINYKSTE